MSNNVIQPVPGEKSGGGRGCLYGCLAGMVVVLVAAALGVYGFYYASKKALDTFTDTAPVELPQSTLSEEEMASATERIQAFMTGVKEQPEQAHEIELSGEELNALINTSPDFQRYGQYVHLEITGDTIGGQVSIPIGEIAQVGFLKGRYLNGDATFSVDISNGRLLVFIDTVRVKGEAIPDAVVQGMRQENLMKDVQIDAEMQEVLDNVEDFSVADGKLKIRVKAREAALTT